MNQSLFGRAPEYPEDLLRKPPRKWHEKGDLIESVKEATSTRYG
jgi:hypothetical protein